MRVVDPFLFERILRGTVHLIVNAELSGQQILGELERSNVIGHVMLRLVDRLKCAALARRAVIESAGIEHDTLTEALDDAESIMEDGALEHGLHVLHLRGVSARDEGSA